MKKQLFRGTIEALKQGPLTVDQISRFTEQPREYVVREIERWEQLPYVKDWIIHDLRTNKLNFTPKIRELSVEVIAKKIQYHFNNNKDKIDLKMDLQKKSNPSLNISTADYDMLDKFLGFKEVEETMDMFKLCHFGNKFDFSTIEI